MRIQPEQRSHTILIFHLAECRIKTLNECVALSPVPRLIMKLVLAQLCQIPHPESSILDPSHLHHHLHIHIHPVCLPQRRLYPRTTDFNNSHPLPLCITMRSRREGKSRGVAGRLSHVMTLIHQEGKWLGTCDSR